MYQPVVARFMSRDPIPNNGIVLLHKMPNLLPYVYAENNPLNLSDPSGEWPQAAFQSACGSTINAPEFARACCTGELTILEVAVLAQVKPPPKEECKTYFDKTVITDKDGNESCKQDYLDKGVKMQVVIDTLIINGKPEMVKRCYGCEDVTCKDKKGKKGERYSCYLDFKKGDLATIHECRCVQKEKPKPK